jgi:ornithine carbamoyltransferase
MLYIGVRNNVLNSLMESLPKLGGELFAAAPVINEPSVDKTLYETALNTGKFHDIGAGNPAIIEVKKIIKDMDVFYTDTWLDLEFVNDPSYARLKKERTARMQPFQINSDLLNGSQKVVLHDMPIHVGYEISRETVEANMKTILQQADNRKYAAQSILMSLVK